MTAQQPDVAGAVLALDQAMIALAVAKSTLLGETGRPMTVPLASLRDREHYTDAYAAGGVTSCSYRCGHTGHGADLADHEFAAHGGGWHRTCR